MRVVDYLNDYNEERIKEKLGYLTPKKRVLGSLIKAFDVCLISLCHSIKGIGFCFYKELSD